VLLQQVMHNMIQQRSAQAVPYRDAGVMQIFVNPCTALADLYRIAISPLAAKISNTQQPLAFDVPAAAGCCAAVPEP
jgi:hypothetical protein